MLEIEKFLKAKPDELEGLSWYAIVSRLGLLSFNTSGNKPIDIIIKLTGISKTRKVLMAGCGSGGTAVYLAEKTGAEVYGIDISGDSIKAAENLASKSQAVKRLYFRTGDAHDLPFKANTFDIVITEFMAFFLRQKAFDGFYKVLKPNGYIALAELMKDPAVSPAADAKILEAEKNYSELLGYDFHIPLYTDHIDHLKKAGFADVEIREKFTRIKYSEQVKLVGGWKNLWKISAATLKLMKSSKELRRKFLQMGLVKRVISKNKSTAGYIFQAVLTGLKTA